MCEQDKVARFAAKVAMKGPGRGKKVFSTTSLTFQLFQTDEAFTVNGRETHIHTKVLSGIKPTSFLSKRTLYLWLTKLYTYHVKYIKINLFELIYLKINLNFFFFP